jgi:hypothetical protein
MPSIRGPNYELINARCAQARLSYRYGGVVGIPSDDTWNDDRARCHRILSRPTCRGRRLMRAPTAQAEPREQPGQGYP